MLVRRLHGWLAPVVHGAQRHQVVFLRFNSTIVGGHVLFADAVVALVAAHAHLDVVYASRIVIASCLLENDSAFAVIALAECAEVGPLPRGRLNVLQAVVVQAPAARVVPRNVDVFQSGASSHMAVRRARPASPLVGLLANEPLVGAGASLELLRFLQVDGDLSEVLLDLAAEAVVAHLLFDPVGICDAQLSLVNPGRRLNALVVSRALSSCSCIADFVRETLQLDVGLADVAELLLADDGVEVSGPFLTRLHVSHQLLIRRHLLRSHRDELLLVPNRLRTALRCVVDGARLLNAREEHGIEVVFLGRGSAWASVVIALAGDEFALVEVLPVLGPLRVTAHEVQILRVVSAVRRVLQVIFVACVLGAIERTSIGSVTAINAGV